MAEDLGRLERLRQLGVDGAQSTCDAGAVSPFLSSIARTSFGVLAEQAGELDLLEPNRRNLRERPGTSAFIRSRTEYS